MKVQDKNIAAAPAAVSVRSPITSERPLTRSEPAERAAAGSVVFDAAKVARLKSEIAAGTYRVDASKIADELITSARELINARKKA
jgi:negative regulator of flagellin synthesis FlgM